MFRNRLTRAGLVLLVLGIAFPCSAQDSAPRVELLRYVPEDTGLCFVVNNLRDQAAGWAKSPWLKALKESALRKVLLDAPEFKNLLKFQQDLEKYLGVDWPTLRDEVLGDAVVFAYRPGVSGNAAGERGVLLLHARQPAVLARFLDNLNRVQKTSGDLKSLETREHQGVKYMCRVEAKETHYYLLEGPFLAYTGNEPWLKNIVEKRQHNKPAGLPVALHLKKAGADNAVAGLWVNPRAFDAELSQKGNGLAGPEALLLNAFLKHWNAFDALVVSCSLQDNFEVRLSILAREQDLPASARTFFMEPARSSEIWKRFPENAILSMAGVIEGSALAAVLGDLAPADLRQTFQKTLQPLTAMVGLDLATDVAPSIGPDWGLCLLPATDPNNVPQVLAALGVRPGPKDLGVDQAIYRGVYFLAGLSLFDYNRQHPQEPISMRALRQGSVEVKYLANDKIFPAGFQPACALKDGYLLLTTTPDAVARFGAATRSPEETTEAPVLRISSVELARVLRQHRQLLIGHLADNNQISKLAATQDFDAMLSVLDLMGRIELTRVSGGGQASLILRINPLPEK